MAKQSQTEQTLITRRNYLAATGAGLVAAGLGAPRRAAAAETIRQGYQTNIWGMPTYYLIESGYLQKHGLAVEEFAVPSGNVTMQQMVARQVDLGTYAGPSFIIGNVKGGLIAIAVIETVGKTARITTRKDLNITKPEQLRGKRIANLTGSSVGNDLVDVVLPHYGLHKGDYQEIRMDITNMVAALSAKTVDAMVNVEPYNVIAVNDGIGSDLVDFSSFDPMPVFMAATPDMVEKRPDVIVAYLKAWLDAANDFKNNAKKVNDTIYQFYASKGYKMSPETFSTALSRVEVKPGFPDMKSYMQQQADILLKNNTIKSVPDWSKALRPDFMEKARG
ncbi:MAG TPA: ABC transporter substrate-binding protein [Xanthobacteraceae bacterium]|nr:ABC transporter substrate-binding protein [Xanthobacteraceae bacterium]